MRNAVSQQPHCTNGHYYQVNRKPDKLRIEAPLSLVVSGHWPGKKISGCSQREKKESSPKPIIALAHPPLNDCDDDGKSSHHQDSKFHSPYTLGAIGPLCKGRLKWAALRAAATQPAATKGCHPHQRDGSRPGSTHEFLFRSWKDRRPPPKAADPR